MRLQLGPITLGKWGLKFISSKPMIHWKKENETSNLQVYTSNIQILILESKIMMFEQEKWTIDIQR